MLLDLPDLPDYGTRLGLCSYVEALYEEVLGWLDGDEAIAQISRVMPSLVEDCREATFDLRLYGLCAEMALSLLEECAAQIGNATCGQVATYQAEYVRSIEE